ncbi:MAG: hypothetical protein WC895_04375 [Candidatus Shapirobacteria bacterium]|jgi:hypothetical protein
MKHLLPLLLLVGCATTPKLELAPLEWKDPPSLQEQATADAEVLGPPIEEDPTKTDALAPPEFAATPLDKDEPAPADGILIDEHTAGKHVLIQAERDRRRRELVIERDARVQEREICTFEINRLAKQAEDLQKKQTSWWSEHKVEMTFVAGIVIGAATAVGCVYGMEQAK